ncbi:hypothetical protein DFA_09878 [Cavenderia fasciculata]|uniref:Major facilitator superfamily (MFS) profile domain-containing protein n=1 Tax=Cavenderia fasciculata TaxID=261658 RepID=F4Q8N6_CACFS|nr:uncharacterized protein DFA_09878 [Cavenderia fasciculata]EGG15055.1 hypothetical protein DFA_09878 [Cavenderia fasciculata]|eukprot:XP_004351775.1 hypothetical protein DFA_09878 [Cavenderia fasciculata]
MMVLEAGDEESSKLLDNHSNSNSNNNNDDSISNNNKDDEIIVDEQIISTIDESTTKLIKDDDNNNQQHQQQIDDSTIVPVFKMSLLDSSSEEDEQDFEIIDEAMKSHKDYNGSSTNLGEAEEEVEEMETKSDSSMGFEDITLEDDTVQEESLQQQQRAKPAASPFKQLLTNKFKSFTHLSTSPGSLFGVNTHNHHHDEDGMSTSPQSKAPTSRSYNDKYHTFPTSPSHSSPNIKLFTNMIQQSGGGGGDKPTPIPTTLPSSMTMASIPRPTSPTQVIPPTIPKNTNQRQPFNQFSNGHNNLLFQSTNNYHKNGGGANNNYNNNNNSSITSTTTLSTTTTMTTTTTGSNNVSNVISSSLSTTNSTTTTTSASTTPDTTVTNFNIPLPPPTPTKILSYITSSSAHHQSVDASTLAQNTLSSLTRPVLSSDTNKISSRILFLLSLSIFFSVSNLYYIHPLLNMVGEEFDQSPTVLSIVTMSVQIGYAFGLLFISILGDVYSKKKLILILSVVTSASLVGVGLSPNIIVMIIFQFLVGATTIIPHIAIPLAVDLTNPAERGGIIGILMSSLFVGLLGARVLSGILGALIGWRILYFVAASTMFLVSILLFIFLPYNPRNQEPIPYHKLLASLVNLVKSNDQLKQTCFIGACIFSTFCILWTTLSFRLNEEPYEYSSGFIGLFGLIGMAGAIAAPIVGKLSDRTNVHLIMVISILICVVGYVLLLTLDSHLIAIIAGIFILDLGVQSCHITNQSRNLKMSETSRSRINACYMASYFIGGSLGSGICGVIYQHWGWSGSSVVALVFLGLAMTCHLMYYKANTTLDNNEYREMDDLNPTPGAPQYIARKMSSPHLLETKQHDHYIELNEDHHDDDHSSYSTH